MIAVHHTSCQPANAEHMSVRVLSESDQKRIFTGEGTFRAGNGFHYVIRYVKVVNTDCKAHPLGLSGAAERATDAVNQDLHSGVKWRRPLLPGHARRILQVFKLKIGVSF